MTLNSLNYLGICLFMSTIQDVETEYLGGFLRLQFPHNLPLLCNALIQARRTRRRGGRGRGGAGGSSSCSSRSRGCRFGRGHPWFVVLTGQLFKLRLESEELLHSYINLVLVPSTNQFLSLRVVKKTNSTGMQVTWGHGQRLDMF